MLSRVLSYYKAELFPILKQCRCVPCLFTLLKNSQSWNITVVLPVLLHGWVFPNLKTFLKFILFYLQCWDVLNVETLMTNTFSYYLAELSLILQHCWVKNRCLPYNTLLKSSQSCLLRYPLSYYIAESLTIADVPCLITLLSWILKHCWVVSCLITRLSYSQFWNNADVYPVIIHCWNAPNLGALLTYTLSYCIAELFPILKHCWSTPCPITMLSYCQSYNIVDVYFLFLHC